MTPTLHDLMHDAVRDAHPDVRTLAATSRRRGLSLRRRRQALAVVGSAATVAAVALGATQLGSGVSGGPAAGRPTLTPSVQPTPTERPPSSYGDVAINGRIVTTALIEALDPMLYGAATNYRGRGSDDPLAPPSEAYGQVDWRPGDASGTSVVAVDVQPRFRRTEVYRCTPSLQACSVTRPLPGTTLMTYEEHTPTGGEHDGIRVVADLLRSDGVRVVASATNGFELPANRWDVTRLRPVLTAEQLTEVVSLPTWGAEMDPRFTTAHLDGYQELPSEVSVTGAPTP